jgi:hypothetical protein
MKFGNEFWLILFQEYISPKLFAVCRFSFAIQFCNWFFEVCSIFFFIFKTYHTEVQVILEVLNEMCINGTAFD